MSSWKHLFEAGGPQGVSHVLRGLNHAVPKPNLPVRDGQSCFLRLSRLCILSLIQVPPMLLFPPRPELPLFCFPLQRRL